MHHALHVHANVRILEPVDVSPAPMTLRKHGEDVAGELLQQWVVVTARQRHAGYSSPVRRDAEWTASATIVAARASTAYGKQKLRANDG